MRDAIDNHAGHKLLAGIGDTDTVHAHAAAAGADFTPLYIAAAVPDADHLLIDDVPVYKGTGKNAGKPLYRWAIHPDSREPLGLMSGTYADHSYGVTYRIAEQMFPGTCDGLTLYGAGEAVSFTQNLLDPIDLGNGDVIQPQLMWLDSLNGTWSTTCTGFAQRPFCSNQLFAGELVLKVKHTVNHSEILRKRSEILRDLREHAIARANMARVLIDQPFTDAEFSALVATLLPRPEPKPGKDEVHGKTLNAWEAKVDACRGHWRAESDGPSARTRWAAYNAIQSAEFHEGLSGGNEELKRAKYCASGATAESVSLLSGRALRELIPA